MPIDLEKNPIARMDKAITDRLRIAFPEKTFTIQRVPQTLTLKEFERIVHLSPFIGLAWMGFRTDDDAGRSIDGEMLWRLIEVFKASSGLQTRFKGDAKGIGLDAMVDMSAALIHGWTIPGVGSVAVNLANSVIADGYTDEAVVIAQVDFKIRFDAPIADYGLIKLDDFRELAMRWTVNGDDDTINDTVVLQEEAP